MKHQRSPDSVVFEMRRKARGESRQAGPDPAPAAGGADSSEDGQEEEGQRPAPGDRSSSGGSVLNQRVVTGKLVRLQLACAKHSAHLFYHRATQTLLGNLNAALPGCGSDHGQVRVHGLQPRLRSDPGGARPAVPEGSR